MKCPNKYFVIGVDEVGRGPLAGPVVSAAVLLRNFKFEILNLKKIKDSKKLSAKQREEIYAEILKCPDFAFGIGKVSEKQIDKINILQATKLAMQKAVKDLLTKVPHEINGRGFSAEQSFNNIFILVDGNMKFEKHWFGENIGYESIVKGDEKIFEISCASIIAKVYRDKLMKNYGKKYLQYGFEKHMGYGTKKHFQALEKFGPCKIHRKTFYPVSKFL